MSAVDACPASAGAGPVVPPVLAARLRTSSRLTVLTGAGMSAESGIATFRGGDETLWRRFDPMQLATAEAFERDPSLVWGWYLWRMAQARAARPHAGHLAIPRLAEALAALHVVTQNVDDLHERAGSEAVVHLHGSLFACRCFDCGSPVTVDVPVDGLTNPELRVDPPRCVGCGGRVRPGVVWFGEALPQDAWRAAVAAVESSDVVLVVGTSGLVHPAAALPEMARRNGAYVVEVNPQPSGIQVDLRLQARAGSGMSALLQVFASR